MIAHEEHGAGVPVVLIHGVGMDRHMWRRCLPALADHRVVLPDLRGHGASARIEPPVTLDDLAADIAAIIDEPAHVVGFSLGALVATQVALTHPHAVRTLTLVSGVANRSEADRQAVRDRLDRARDDFVGAVEAAIDRWFRPSWRAAAPELVDEVRSTLRANHHPSYLAAYAVFAEADAQLWPQLGRLTAPTLAVTGADDTGSTPAMTRALVDTIPRASAAVISGAAHLLPLERPEALMPLILEHLRRTDADRDHSQALPALHQR